MQTSWIHPVVDFDCSGLQTLGAKHEELVSCNTTSMCIYPSWICDRSNDCWDNNDEKNCNYTSTESLSSSHFLGIKSLYLPEMFSKEIWVDTHLPFSRCRPTKISIYRKRSTFSNSPNG